MSMLDITIGLVLIFVIAIAAVTANHFYQAVDPTDIFNASTEAQAAYREGGNVVSILDGLIIFFILAIAIGAIISAFMAPSHPALFLLMLGIGVFTAIVMAVMSNAYSEFVTGTGFSVAANSFSMTTAAMQALPVIGVVLSLIVAIIMFGKRGA